MSAWCVIDTDPGINASCIKTRSAANRVSRPIKRARGNQRVIAQMRSARVLASFVADPSGDTVFVGLWQVNGSRSGHLPDPYPIPPPSPHEGSVIFDLERLDALREYRGRIVIDWGGGERAWVQYADRRDERILEVRRRAEEPGFPGYSRFGCGLHEVDALPSAWLEALRVIRGVYLSSTDSDRA
jgi:hypothetical protein